MVSPRKRGRLGEQVVILILASQVAAAWLPSQPAAPEGPFVAAGPAPGPGIPVAPSTVQERPARAAYARPASITDIGQRRAALSAPHVAPALAVRGIPTPALVAYQRGATVLRAADPDCRVDWELLAAIGRVESDHGRYGGATLGRDGVSRPGIYGIRLDGTHNTRRITDTDAGRFDTDTAFDRAVGPLQFIPATWLTVGVDADGDGARDPQDIDDAALAAAVYLCAGPDDLATDAGRRAAVHRYNHSGEYVELVLAVRLAYVAGDWTAVRPIAAAITVPDPVDALPVGPAAAVPAVHAEPVPDVHTSPVEPPNVGAGAPVDPWISDPAPPGSWDPPEPPDTEAPGDTEPPGDTVPPPDPDACPDTETLLETQPISDPQPIPEPEPLPDTEPLPEPEPLPDTEPCSPPEDDSDTCVPEDEVIEADEADEAPVVDAPVPEPVEPCDSDPLPEEALPVPVGVPVRPLP